MARRVELAVAGKGWAVLFAALYALLAVIALRLTQSTDGIAYIWPSSGVAVAGVLLLRGSDRVLMLALIAGASMSANLWGGTGLAACLVYTTANICEALLAGRIAGADNPADISFDRPRWVARFAGAAAAAALASGAIASLTSDAEGFVDFFLSWTATVLLGIVIVTPLLVTAIRSLKLPVWDHASGVTGSWRRRVLVMSAVLAGATVSFSQVEFPLLFVPFALVTLATYFLGINGAVASIFVIALVGSVFSTFQVGPVTMMASVAEQVYFLQLYLLILMMSALPLAILLAQARARDRVLRQSTGRLEAAEKTARLGHWHYELGDSDVLWSAEMFRIYGLPKCETISRAQAQAAYHPDDRERVQALLDRAIAERGTFEFEARILRPDGTTGHVAGRGEVEVMGGEVTGLFGILLDISDRIASFEELRTSRSLAETRAAEALLLSETDQLTGIANRRRGINVLSAAIERAASTDWSFAVLAFDIDYFKAINDTYGHAVGDSVLAAIAREGQKPLRTGDLLARMGGEEFLVVLPDADVRVAQEVAERLRCLVETMDFGSDGPEAVSISLGVAVYQPGADVSWLLQAADNALYEAKRAGRNRVALAA